MKRKPIKNKSTDKKVFSQTASKQDRKNRDSLLPTRGGYRLT